MATILLLKSRMTGEKVLIVDDEKDICYFLNNVLIKKNYVPSIAHDLAGANKILETDKPSILLLDNHLPDGLGINAIEKIKKDNPGIKIIMITAHDSQQDRDKAYRNGADYFLSKPFTLMEVNEVIDTLSSHPKNNVEDIG